MSKDDVKNVNIKQCFGTILISLIMACIAFIPFYFGGSEGVVFSYTKLPIVGDPSDMTALEGWYTLFVLDKLNLTSNENVVKVCEIFINYGFYAYFGILAANIVFSFMLILSRSTVLRSIFKIFAIVFGFAFIVFNLFMVVQVVGFVFYLIGVFSSGGSPDIMAILGNSGIVFFFGAMICSFIMIFNEFRAFARLY